MTLSRESPSPASRSGPCGSTACVVGGRRLLGGVAAGRRDRRRGSADRLAAAICATQTGVCEEALAITARYVSEREQFGSKLGTFQAVGQRVADAYIDTEAIRLTALQAIWRLDGGPRCRTTS